MQFQNARRYAQLGLLHTAVALTALPIDDTLNRVMRVELGLPLLLVTFLVSAPYLFAPLQIAVGALADKYPLAGRRRTPYILLGLVAGVAGVALLPVGLYLTDRTAEIVVTLLGFLLWGIGYNFTAVSYFSLASELFGESRRSRAVAVMYFLMLLTVIIAGISLSRMLDPFTPQALTQAIWAVAAVALGLGLVGLIGLEPRASAAAPAVEPFSFTRFQHALTANPTARIFFIYMLVLLTAILGQDILIEPFAAQTLGLPVNETSRLRSIYGVCFLVALLLAALAERFLSKRRVAQASAVGGIVAFGLILVSGLLASSGLFYAGLVVLGLAVGVSTVANHSLMLDMTTPQNVGLFIGAWGMATSLARLSGGLLGGFVGDVTLRLSGDVGLSYAFVFGVQTLLLALSLWLLRGIDVGRFQRQAGQSSVAERAAAASGAS
jgi:BCD family chlorophyll transporter-like MFS transporter